MQGKTLPSRGSALCKTLSTPSNFERRELSSLFPSSRPTCSYKRPFDPSAECVALPQQKKKKAAGIGLRAISREVVVFRNVVPIKKFRSELNNERRIQNLKFKRSMTPSQVKSVIIDGFRHIHGFSRFQYLENTCQSPPTKSLMELLLLVEGELFICVKCR